MNTQRVIGIILIIGIILGVIVLIKRGGFKAINNTPIIKQNAGKTISIDGQTFNIQIANTEAEKEKGLADRQNLAQDSGMLFPFDRPDYYGFWMKGMLIPLDIIYFNKDKIVTIVNDIQPPTPANNQLPIFKPVSPADSVLEINAGLSKKYNFQVGDSVKFSL